MPAEKGEATRASHRGGRRAGAGRHKGSPTGGPSQRSVARFRAWTREFVRSLGETELAGFRATMGDLAEARGFRPPPTL
jgi:hypothetical protein